MQIDIKILAISNQPLSVNRAKHDPDPLKFGERYGFSNRWSSNINIPEDQTAAR
jgi:hypothetical protein